MFSVLTTPEKFETETITGHIGSVFVENSGGLGGRTEASQDYRDVIVFLQLLFKSVFRPHYNMQSQRFQIPSVFGFRDGLVWTVNLTVEIKLPFQICGRSLFKNEVEN